MHSLQNLYHFKYTKGIIIFIIIIIVIFMIMHDDANFVKNAFMSFCNYSNY